MEEIRKPFQGVKNIVLFNWHFYLIGFVIGVLLVIAMQVTDGLIKNIFFSVGILIFTSMLISLAVSYFIYDYSKLYKFDWIIPHNEDEIIVNIHAGFDETTVTIKNRFKNSYVKCLDFYDPEKHTEPSIERARKAYPPVIDTIQINTTMLPLGLGSVDKIYLILAAHEIRNTMERENFFTELNKVLKQNGKIYVTEHLRDLPNFLAFNFGSFHFYSKKSWLSIFRKANLELMQEFKCTFFISTFILHKNGDLL